MTASLESTSDQRRVSHRLNSYGRIVEAEICGPSSGLVYASRMQVDSAPGDCHTSVTDSAWVEGVGAHGR